MIFPLITIQRACQNSVLNALNASNPAYLVSLLAAASDSICRYTARDFTFQSYSEYRDVGVLQRGVPILLRQFPIGNVTRVALANSAIQVQNSSNTTNQRATVATSETACTLFTVASAMSTTTVLPYAQYPTLNALGNAITAVGNGWSINIQSGANGSYGPWPSADLKPLQGAVSAFLGGCWLELYEDVSIATGPFAGTGQWEDGNGWGDWSMCGPGWRLQGETGEMYFKCRRGSLILRIDYTAGYQTVPESVQEACVQLIQWTYQNSTVNLALKSARIEQYGYTLGDSGKWPTSVLSALNSVKAYDRVAQF